MFDGTKPGPGRPPGSQNKMTAKLRSWSETYGDAWVDKVWEIATTAEKDSDKLQALKILGSKCLPDLKAIELSGEVESTSTQYDLTKLTNEQLLVLKSIVKKEPGE